MLPENASSITKSTTLMQTMLVTSVFFRVKKKSA
jgi:hypothetical protein